MKTTLLTVVITASIFLAACGKKNANAAPPDSAPASGSAAPANAASGGIATPALTEWTQGDKNKAVDVFVATDWSKGGSLFPASSLLSLTEAQLKTLPQEQVTKGTPEMSATVNALRELSKAVLQAGRDAAAKGDADRASKCFTAVKACGTALDKQENLVVLIRFGQSIQRDADRELRGSGR